MMNEAEFDNIERAERTFWWYRGMREILWGALERSVGTPGRARILDAGCGTGFFAGWIRERTPAAVFGCDFSRRALRLGRARGYLELGAQADLGRLPFPDASFDLVFCLDVLTYFDKGAEERPFSEFARVLRPGGTLALRVAAMAILESRHSAFTNEKQRFSRRRVLDLARRNGLEVLLPTHANCLLAPLALVKFRVWEPLFARRPASGIEPVPAWLDRLFLSVLRWEAARIRRGAGFPFGQSFLMIAERRDAANA